MAVELDALDLQILGLLLQDGRAPVSQLADAVGLSRPAVADRIEKLQNQGVIRGTTIVVDPQSIGREVTAFVSARATVHFTAKQWSTFQALMKSDEVLEVHTVAGDDCYLVKVRTDSIASLTSLVSRLTAPPLNLSTRTTIVMQTHCEKIGGIVLGEKL